MEQEIVALKKKLASLEGVEDKYEKLQQQYASAKTEIKQLKNEKLSLSTPNKSTHSAEFWIDIKNKINKDPDYIKNLIKLKQMSVYDTDDDGHTLLLYAARNGSYEITQFCLNFGSDINHKDDEEQDALWWARYNGYYHVEQLLLFSQMNVNVGNKIKLTSNVINKQKGISQNIIEQLDEIGDQTKQIFCKTLIELMINIINKKLSFDDVLLNVCWDVICLNNSNPLSSELWQMIKSVCKNVIENGSKRDWHWFKTFILPSSIWFRTLKVDDNEQKHEESKQESQENTTKTPTNYLYFKLLKLVQSQAKTQLIKLEENLNKLTNKDKNAWEKLVCWDIPDEYDVIRQDRIPNGLEAQYSYSQLLEKSSARFNAIKFYDNNQYLSEIVLLAQIVDDDFQKSVQKIFNVDRQTQIAHIGNTDEKKEDQHIHTVRYMRGPVKLIERARAKADNDYADAPYPCSACVLDLNRCSLVCDDIGTLLKVMQLFVNKVKYFQSGSIIGIVRDKNGFKDYIKEVSYADIKLNVLIKGKKNNIIGEVQFLLQTMMDYKETAHNLYAIERQSEYIENAVSKILPMLLDEEKQLFIAGGMNDVKSLYGLMAINNFSKEDIISRNKKYQTILLQACEIGNNKVFLFLKSILGNNLFLKYLFFPAIYNDKPIEMAIQRNNEYIVKNAFQMKQVQEKYIADDNELFRLLYWLLAWCANNDIQNYVLSTLNISNEKVKQMMNHKYPSPKQEFGDGSWKYHRYRIVGEVVKRSKSSAVKKLVSIIGERKFINQVFIGDDWNINAMERAVENNKMKIIEYMFSFKEIKNKYLNNYNQLFRLIYFLFVKCSNNDINIIDYVLSELKISGDNVTKILNYKYVKKAKTFGEGYLEYHMYSILEQIIYFDKFVCLKKLRSIIGDESFVDAMFISDGWGDNGIVTTIDKNNLTVMKYVLSIDGIKQKCVNDKGILLSIIQRVENDYNESMALCIINELQLTKTKLQQLQKKTDVTKWLDLCK